MNIEQERQAAVAEAKTWINTPYHHEARVKGPDGGIDCAQLLYMVYRACDLIPEFTIEHYSHDWHLHQNAERYLGKVFDYSVWQEDPNYKPQPADIVIWKVGRVFSHAGIFTDYPTFIHAYVNRVCNYENIEKAVYLNVLGRGDPEQGKQRERRIYTLQRWML